MGLLGNRESGLTLTDLIAGSVDPRENAEVVNIAQPGIIKINPIDEALEAKPKINIRPEPETYASDIIQEHPVFWTPWTGTKEIPSLGKKSAAAFTGAGHMMLDTLRGIQQLYGKAFKDQALLDKLEEEERAMRHLYQDPSLGRPAFWGSVGGALAEPVGLAIPMGKPKSLVSLAKRGAAIGGLLGATSYVPEDWSRAYNIGLGVAGGGIGTPAAVLGTEALANVGRTILKKPRKWTPAFTPKETVIPGTPKKATDEEMIKALDLAPDIDMEVHKAPSKEALQKIEKPVPDKLPLFTGRDRNIRETVKLHSFAPAAGIEVDEEGNVDFNPTKALIGLAGSYALARIAQPVMKSGKLKWKHINAPKYVAKSIRKADDVVRPVVAKNPLANELTASFAENPNVPLRNVETKFNSIVNRDEEGLSLFDRVWMHEIDTRLEYLGKPEFQPYAKTAQNVSRSRGGNLKTEGEILPLDTSRGCLNFCPECYAFGTGTKSKRSFVEPTAVELTGNFFDDPKAIRRIGEVGEPSFHPIKYKQVEEQFKQMGLAGKKFSPEELEDLVGTAYDWSWTNEQLRKTNLHTPEGQKKTFIITKLNSIENFDPSVIRNLEVSIDPLVPRHFFRALDNVEKLMAMDPTLNISLRVRSVNTMSDEVNALQKIAVDVANKYDNVVLETRLRFKSSQGLERSIPEPTYWYKGNQYVDPSYFLASKPHHSKFTKKVGNEAIIHLEDRTKKGVKQLKTTVRATLAEGQKTPPKEASVWRVVSHEGAVAKDNLTRSDAISFAQNLAATEPNRIALSPGEIKKISKETSPLSRMGIKEENHFICNDVNEGGGACMACQNCRKLLKRGEAKAEKAAIEPIGSKEIPQFRTTDDAELFGARNFKNEEVIAELNKTRSALDTRIKEIGYDDPAAEALVHQAQLVREAREVASGQLPPWSRAAREVLGSQGGAIDPRMFREAGRVAAGAIVGGAVGGEEGAAIGAGVGAAPTLLKAMGRKWPGSTAGGLMGGFVGSQTGEEGAPFHEVAARTAIGALMGFLGGRLTHKIPIKTGAFGLEREFKSLGEFLSWGIIDNYGLPKDFVRTKKILSAHRNHIAAQMMDLAQEAGSLPANERKILYGMIQGEHPGEESLSLLKEKSRTKIREFGQQLVDYGLLSPETFAKNADTYIHRSYLKHAGKGKGAGFLGRKIKMIGDELRPRGFITEVPEQDFERWATKGWERFGRSKTKGKIKIRRQLTKEERQLRGEIEDAAYAIAETGRLLSNDIATYKFYDDVAQMYGSDVPVEGFAQIPDKALKGTNGRIKTYGKLAGKWVPPEIHDDLLMLNLGKNIKNAPVIRQYRQLNAWWKVTKTAFNPVVHTNNVVSNMSLLYLSKSPFRRLAESGAEMLSYRRGKDAPFFRQAMELGVFDADFANQELKHMTDKWLKAYSSVTDNPEDMLSHAIKITKGAATAPMRKMIDLYQSEDHVFRLAVFIDRMKKGWDPVDAAMDARKWFIDYDINAPIINVMRELPTPFLAFTYRAVPLIFEAATERPTRVAALAALGWGLNELGEIYGSGDTEAERRLMPEKQKGHIFGLSLLPPQQIKMPFSGPSGEGEYLDITRWIPGGDIFDISGQGVKGGPVPYLPDPLQPSWGILGSFVNAMQGYDPYMGETLRGLGASDWEDAQIKAKFLAKQMTPNFPGVPGSYSTKKILDSLRGVETPLGDVLPPEQAVAQTLGVKIRPADITKMTRRAQFDSQQRIEAYQEQLKGYHLDYSRGRISPEQYIKQTNRIKEKVRELQEQLRKKMTGE